LQYYIGCSGWSYSAWQGPFYPCNLDSSSDWLPFYASVFNYVEIDSSFYKTPNVFTVNTDDKRLKDVSRELEYFFQSMLPLKEKTLALLIQLPPSLNR
jgi:uncharacterized protein YecE (DUF72 family)